MGSGNDRSAGRPVLWMRGFYENGRDGLEVPLKPLTVQTRGRGLRSHVRVHASAYVSRCRRSPKPILLVLALLQMRPHDLACCRLGGFIDELDTSRPLVGGHVFLRRETTRLVHVSDGAVHSLQGPCRTRANRQVDSSSRGSTASDTGRPAPVAQWVPCPTLERFPVDPLSS